MHATWGKKPEEDASLHLDTATCKGTLRPPHVYNRVPSQKPIPQIPPPSCEIALYPKPEWGTTSGRLTFLLLTPSTKSFGGTLGRAVFLFCVCHPQRALTQGESPGLHT